jgi:hypothetical protein
VKSQRKMPRRPARASRPRRNPLTASELANRADEVEDTYRLPYDIAEQIVRHLGDAPLTPASVQRAYNELYIEPLKGFRVIGTGVWLVDGSLTGEHRVLYATENRNYALVRRLPEDEYGNEVGEHLGFFDTPKQAIASLTRRKAPARQNRSQARRNTRRDLDKQIEQRAQAAAPDDVEVLHVQQDGDDLSVTFGAPTHLTHHNLLYGASDSVLREIAAKAMDKSFQDVELEFVETDSKHYPGQSIVWEASYIHTEDHARPNRSRARR